MASEWHPRVAWTSTISFSVVWVTAAVAIQLFKYSPTVTDEAGHSIFHACEVPLLGILSEMAESSR